MYHQSNSWAWGVVVYNVFTNYTYGCATVSHPYDVAVAARVGLTRSPSSSS